MEALELNGRSILVTGADGLLGAWLVKAAFLAGAVHLAPQAGLVLPVSLLRDGCAVFGAAVELARRQNLNRGWRGLHPREEASLAANPSTGDETAARSRRTVER